MGDLQHYVITAYPSFISEIPLLFGDILNFGWCHRELPIFHSELSMFDDRLESLCLKLTQIPVAGEMMLNKSLIYGKATIALQASRRGLSEWHSGAMAQTVLPSGFQEAA